MRSRRQLTILPPNRQARERSSTPRPPRLPVLHRSAPCTMDGHTSRRAEWQRYAAVGLYHPRPVHGHGVGLGRSTRRTRRTRTGQYPSRPSRRRSSYQHSDTRSPLGEPWALEMLTAQGFSVEQCCNLHSLRIVGNPPLPPRPRARAHLQAEEQYVRADAEANVLHNTRSGARHPISHSSSISLERPASEVAPLAHDALRAKLARVRTSTSA